MTTVKLGFGIGGFRNMRIEGNRLIGEFELCIDDLKVEVLTALAHWYGDELPDLREHVRKRQS